MLSAKTAGTPAAATAPAMNRSPAPKRSVAFSSTRAASTSPKASSTAACIRRVSESKGFWKPGKSSSTTCTPGRSTTAVMRRRVVCGWSDTMLTLRPTRLLTSVDLPALGRPSTATNPERKSSLTARDPAGTAQ